MANGDGADAVQQGLGLASTASMAAGQPLLAAGFGLGQIVVGQIQKKQAERAKPPLEDPMQAQMLKEFRQKALLSRTGAASQSAREELLDQEGRLSRGIQRSTGGAGGATIAGLARLRGQTGKAFNQVLAADQERSFRYETMSADLVNRMAQRRMDIQAYEWGSLLAREASNKKAGMENLLAGLELSAGQSGSGNDTSNQSEDSEGKIGGALKSLFAQPGGGQSNVQEVDDVMISPGGMQPGENNPQMDWGFPPLNAPRVPQ